MDLLDKKILCELDNDCRQSHERIAKSIGSSRAVVRYRIKKLEEEGAIQNYIASINLGRLGFTTYKIYFKLFNIDDKAEKDFFSFMSKEKCVIHCLKTEGAFDVSIVVAVESVKELDEFLTRMRTSFYSVIKESRISIVAGSKIYKLGKVLLGKAAKEPKMETISGNKEKAELDAKDRLILSLIASNANMPIVEIASKSHLSIDIVKYRMKKLSSSGVVNAFRAVFDMSKMGFYHYVILIRTRKSAKQDEAMINSWSSAHHSVMYITKRIGDWDYEINVALKGIDDFNAFIAEMRKQLSGILESYGTIMNTKVIKLNYLPL